MRLDLLDVATTSFGDYSAAEHKAVAGLYTLRQLTNRMGVLAAHLPTTAAESASAGSEKNKSKRKKRVAERDPAHCLKKKKFSQLVEAVVSARSAESSGALDGGLGDDLVDVNAELEPRPFPFVHHHKRAKYDKSTLPSAGPPIVQPPFSPKYAPAGRAEWAKGLEGDDNFFGPAVAAVAEGGGGSL